MIQKDTGGVPLGIPAQPAWQREKLSYPSLCLSEPKVQVMLQEQTAPKSQWLQTQGLFLTPAGDALHCPFFGTHVNKQPPLGHCPSLWQTDKESMANGTLALRASAQK